MPENISPDSHTRQSARFIRPTRHTATSLPHRHQSAAQGPSSYASWEIIILAKLPIYAKLYLTRQSAQYTLYGCFTSEIIRTSLCRQVCNLSDFLKSNTFCKNYKFTKLAYLAILSELQSIAPVGISYLYIQSAWPQSLLSARLPKKQHIL